MTAVELAAPDRAMRAILDYAEGSQVVAEGVVSSAEGGIHMEIPFISFLLFDGDSLAIRDRSQITLDLRPACDENGHS